MKFKADRQREEWESGQVDLRLVYLVSWIDGWRKIVYPDYEFTVTDVFRTDEEQDKIYLNHNDPKVIEKYKKKPWKSVHQYFRGVDIRTYDMPGKMAYQLEQLLKQVPYDINRPRMRTAIFHNVGTGAHMHLQVVG